MAAVRIAGPQSKSILERLFRADSRSRFSPFLMRHGYFLSCSRDVIDEVLAVFMPAGRSYTGLDQAEIFCHGGRQVVRLVLDEIISAGARPAEPGEFTKLAFLNGRIDLSRAEAVAELIAASTETSYRAGREHLVGSYSTYVEQLRGELLAALADIEAAIDFSEEDLGQADLGKVQTQLKSIGLQVERLAASYRGGRIIREGFRIAICGRPNAGKSSLFNLLLEHERALVDPGAGTTRDYLSEWLDLDGFAVNIVDTAGIRESSDRVERKGQTKAKEIIEQADLVLWLADVSLPKWQANLADDLRDLSETHNLLIGNKIDLCAHDKNALPNSIYPLSCVTRDGLDQIRQEILAIISEEAPDLTSGQVVTSARHKHCLDLAAGAIGRTLNGAAGGESVEILAFELREAADHLGEITGQVYTEEILSEIFSRFCVGK